MIFLVISILLVQIWKSALRIRHNKRQIYKSYNSPYFEYQQMAPMLLYSAFLVPSPMTVLFPAF